MISSNTFTARRAELEAKIYDLIALLDLLDGDPDLEDDHDEREPEETDLNGDESDYNGDEGDLSDGRIEGGSGL